MNLLLFLVMIVISFIVVRIGAIAFELTGLEWSLAKFQALSCFSGTGFTTKEAELVVGNPQRRRIASVLMVLGNAGLVTLIATFANSLRPNIVVPKLKLPFIELFVPSRVVPYVNLIIIIIFVYFGYRMFTNSNITKKLTDYLRRKIIKKDFIKQVSFEELLVSTGGYGVSAIEICKDSPIIGKEIKNADLRRYDVNVLAVEREGEVFPNPSSELTIVLGDRLICFGKLEIIRNHLCKVVTNKGQDEERHENTK
ncbi:cation:proton antiporter regulatory subunit [Candidatus Omnitrophota bacterium]